jgi:hypothetical protein
MASPRVLFPFLNLCANLELMWVAHGLVWPKGFYACPFSVIACVEFTTLGYGIHWLIGLA